MENIRIEVWQEESISERIKRVEKNLRGYTEEKYPVGDIIIDLGYMIDYIKYSFREPDRFEAENQRLKEQLDREIHINRKMKKCLEKYANTPDHVIKETDFGTIMLNCSKIAKQVLKEIDNEE